MVRSNSDSDRCMQTKPSSKSIMHHTVNNFVWNLILVQLSKLILVQLSNSVFLLSVEAARRRQRRAYYGAQDLRILHEIRKPGKNGVEPCQFCGSAFYERGLTARNESPYLLTDRTSACASSSSQAEARRCNKVLPKLGLQINI
jgi:hypothetical protein